MIEDRDLVQHTIETMLKRDHHHVDSFADPLLALDHLRENPNHFDIVITDYTMPNLNGADMIAEIQADFPRLPILLMSGDSNKLSNVAETPHPKNLHVLAKPVSADGLRHLLSQILKA